MYYLKFNECDYGYFKREMRGFDMHTMQDSNGFSENEHILLIIVLNR